MKQSEEQSWDLHIQAKRGLLQFNFSELWRYRDLIILFVKRDYLAVVKQTVLGPAWYIIQPILTTLTFTVVFGMIAGIPTDNTPQILFYMCGVVTWSYFSYCISKTSNTFIANITIFEKVYFPRLVMPLATTISGLIAYGIQFGILLCFWCYYYFFTDSSVEINAYAALLPVLVITMGFLGMGCGIIISALTAKYRDLSFLVGFGVQLWLYLSPVIYSVNTLKENMVGLPWMEKIIMTNPMTAILETMRYGWLGAGSFDLAQLCYSIVFSLIVLLIGLLLFNRVDKSFADTV